MAKKEKSQKTEKNISMDNALTNLSEIEDDLSAITDLDLLKFQLIRQRENLFSAIDSLIKSEFSYGDTVSRVDYDTLSARQKQLNDEYRVLKDEYRHLGHACLYVINKTHDLIEERNKYYQEWQTNKSLLTPRPDWDKVSNIIDGGIERWKILSTGKSSEQLVGILMREIVNGNEMETIKEDDYFSAIGDDLMVLPFLRMPKYNRVVNRKMRRRKTGLLVKEIWKDKIRGTAFQDLLADHVSSYFEKQCHSKVVAIEMGYNLRDACQRYRHSEQINLFWGIITGQLEEFVYHHQMGSISRLLQHLIKMKTHFSSQPPVSSSPKARRAIVGDLNSPLHGIPSRRLSSLSVFSTRGYQEPAATENDRLLTNGHFIESLKLLYPHKTSAQIDELFFSAQRDLQYPSESIEFHLLFLEDDEGRFGEFLSTVIRQLNQEKISYVQQIKQILLGFPLITVSQFCRAIYMVDPKIPQHELHRYIEWVFSVRNFRSSQQIKPLDLEDLLRRLENCACFKH